jgi:hypothetical protein
MKHIRQIPRYTQKISQIINHVKEVGVPFVTLPPTITAPVCMNFTDYCHFDWVMKPPTPVMMDECLPYILDGDSDDEFDYDFIDDGRLVNMFPYSPHKNIQLNTLQ